LSVIVTDEAKVRLVDAMKDAEYEKPALRIIFAGFGWGGPRLGLALEELEESDDFVMENNDIQILLDDRIKHYIETGPKIVVDYRDTAYGAGFVVDGGSSC
jgi:HesB-like selenoprotein